MLDLFARVFGMKPYRCRQCMRRFYLPSRLDQKIRRERAWLRAVKGEHHSRPPRVNESKT
jgi:hypothetical protein